MALNEGWSGTTGLSLRLHPLISAIRTYSRRPPRSRKEMYGRKEADSKDYFKTYFQPRDIDGDGDWRICRPQYGIHTDYYNQTLWTHEGVAAGTRNSCRNSLVSNP